MNCNCATWVADLSGWIGGLLGVVGALFLIRPLFILLDHREALEAIGYGLDLNLLTPDLAKSAQEAREILATKAFSGRHRWKSWVKWGLFLLVLSLLAVLIQGACILKAL